ncbi:MAG: precorrin-4 C(11)-methyltransferase [Planctomycetota bacterium]|jgi:precorrin-4/cobalt-precorrin-4 C11-methyltransferase|nr:precorrin-4 C(11)-methyltransferase [Planctomycetota bacterium]
MDDDVETRVWFVGAGPGDPELLTVKAARLLGSAECCVYAGSLVPDAITSLVPADVQRLDSARMDLTEIVDAMVQAARVGKRVVRLHSGDPSIYGAIAEQMRELDKAGVAYGVVPGVSSFLAAAAALKTELTSPGVAQTVVLTRASGRTHKPERESLAAVSRLGATVCLFLSVDKLADAARELEPEFGSDCPAAVVRHVSRPDQIVVRGTIADIAAKTAAAGITRTALAVFGRALAGAGEDSRLYSRSFEHGYRDGRTQP